MDKAIISEIKEFINADKKAELQDFFEELMESSYDRPPDWSNIFQAVYIHACLRKKREIADWLKTLFTRFDPIQQIAFRQVFFYGEWLLKH